MNSSKVEKYPVLQSPHFGKDGNHVPRMSPELPLGSLNTVEKSLKYPQGLFVEIDKRKHFICLTIQFTVESKHEP